MNKLYLCLLLLSACTITVYCSAVQPVDKDCTKDCPASNYTCCGCCTDGAECFGNNIDRKCCPQGSAYCGCVSNRAYCNGVTFGEPNPGSTFGTCYDASSGATCTYDPSPNNWVLCPAGYSSCQGSSYFSCCSGGQVCTTTVSDSYPICADITTQPPASSCPSECGSQPCCEDTRIGNVCYNPSTHHCVTDNANGERHLCASTDQSCGSWCYDPSMYKCNSDGTIDHI